MQVIANNLLFKNKAFINAARSGDKASMSAFASELKAAGADIINVNLSLDGDGDEKYMATAVEAIQRVGLPLFIDSRNPKAHLAAVKAATVPLTLNYVSMEESRASDMDKILGIAAEYKTDIVLYAMWKNTPYNFDARLTIINELLEKANGAGIKNDRIVVDPVILHLAGGVGQEHAVAVQETLYELRELVEPPLRTTCWLSNISAGAPKELRPSINNTFLAMLSGLGLWSASMDVLNKETMRTVRLIRAINNKAVYSISDATL
jgi:5-methyltetrahydrofolate corrinoid/iron sulfur protein methyltransferase